jgi:hypothetical protein
MLFASASAASTNRIDRALIDRQLWHSVAIMRRALPLLLALAAIAGCGDSSNTDDGASTTTSTPAATSATPAAGTGTGTGASKDSPYVVVTSLLGKPLPNEPGCGFARTFIPNTPTAYDGGLALTITCKPSHGFKPTGQIVNRPGNKPTEITCRDTIRGQLFCIYAPSVSVGLYFTGTDRAVTRRRLEHLIEVVAPLPTGITPLSGAATG